MKSLKLFMVSLYLITIDLNNLKVFNSLQPRFTLSTHSNVTFMLGYIAPLKNDFFYILFITVMLMVYDKISITVCLQRN